MEQLAPVERGRGSSVGHFTRSSRYGLSTDGFMVSVKEISTVTVGAAGSFLGG